MQKPFSYFIGALGSSVSSYGKEALISNVVCEGSEITLFNCSKNLVGAISSMCGSSAVTVTCTSRKNFV